MMKRVRLWTAIPISVFSSAFLLACGPVPQAAAPAPVVSLAPPEPPAAPREPAAAEPTEIDGLPTGAFSLRSVSTGECLTSAHRVGTPKNNWGGLLQGLSRGSTEAKLKLDPGPLLEQAPCNASSEQRFRINRRLDGTFSIQAVGSDLCLDVRSWRPKDASPTVSRMPCDDSISQRFRVDRDPAGTWKLVSAQAKTCLGVLGTTRHWVGDGLPISALARQLRCDDDNERRWTPVP